jgi:Transposase DDE domain.
MLLQKTVRSIQTHIHTFFEALGHFAPSLTASAWCQARLKLSHSAFIALNQEAVLKVVYRDMNHPHLCRWKDHRVVAIDSSLLRLPNEAALGEEFGWVELGNQLGVLGRYPQARLSVLTDVLNRIAVQTKLVPWQEGERALARQHLPCLLPNDVALMDRGYAGYKHWAAWVKAQRFFVCRCQTQSFKVINELFAANQEGRSLTVKLVPNEHDLEEVQQEGLPEEITIRFVTLRLPTGELEVLATNLLDEQAYPTDCFAELYGRRWGIETYYGVLKGRLELENFTGRSVEAVRQDVHATIFLSNLESLLIAPVNQQLKQESRDLQYQRQVNHSVSFHTIKHRMIELLLSQEPHEEVVQQMQELFHDNPTVIRPNRKVARRRHSGHRSSYYQRCVKKTVY